MVLFCDLYQIASGTASVDEDGHTCFDVKKFFPDTDIFSLADVIGEIRGVKLHPQFTEPMVAVSSSSEGDTVVVASMDRLARSLNDLLEKVNDFGNRGVTIKFLKENIEITSGNISPISRLLLGIMGAVAEFERNLIRERQAEGIALAKQRGVYAGRKPVSPEKIAEVARLIEEGVPKIVACKRVGIGRTTYYTHMERKNHD